MMMMMIKVFTKKVFIVFLNKIVSATLVDNNITRITNPVPTVVTNPLPTVVTSPLPTVVTSPLPLTPPEKQVFGFYSGKINFGGEKVTPKKRKVFEKKKVRSKKRKVEDDEVSTSSPL